MGYIIYSFYIMLTIFVTYVGFIWIKYGILPSISYSYYELPKKLKPLFTLFCWGFALPVAIIGITLAEESIWQFLAFFASGGIMFVGTAPDFKSETGNDKIIHYVSALISVIFSQLYIALVFPEMIYVPIIFLLSSILLILFKRKVKEIWWIELFAFSSLCYTFALQIFQ